MTIIFLEIEHCSIENNDKYFSRHKFAKKNSALNQQAGPQVPGTAIEQGTGSWFLAALEWGCVVMKVCYFFSALEKSISVPYGACAEFFHRLYFFFSLNVAFQSVFLLGWDWIYFIGTALLCCIYWCNFPVKRAGKIIFSVLNLLRKVTVLYRIDTLEYTFPSSSWINLFLPFFSQNLLCSVIWKYLSR